MRGLPTNDAMLERYVIDTNCLVIHLIKDDEDDNKFVDCAACGNARLIVTNDKHFNVLDKEAFPKVFHMDIDDFLELRNRNNGN